MRMALSDITAKDIIAVIVVIVAFLLTYLKYIDTTTGLGIIGAIVALYLGIQIQGVKAQLKKSKACA
jgi:hypothetical protein